MKYTALIGEFSDTYPWLEPTEAIDDPICLKVDVGSAYFRFDETGTVQQYPNGLGVSRTSTYVQFSNMRVAR